MSDKSAYTLIMKKRSDKLPAPDGPNIRICAHANLRKALRVVSQAYDAALKPSGLRATQFTLLAVVAGRGELPLSKLAEILVMDRTTLTRNLKPLVRQGWLSIGREDDERVRLISATDAGRQIVAEATPLWRDVQSRVSKGLGDERLSGMINDLNAVAETVRPA